MPTSSTVLDLHLLWHPNDASAEPIAQEIEEHFLHQSCTGLHAGAIAVHRRSKPWTDKPGSPPRPIARPDAAGAAPYTAIIVLVGTELMRAAQSDGSAWGTYLDDLHQAADAAEVQPPRLILMAILVPGTRRPPNARLSQMLSKDQYLAEPDRHALRHGSPGWLGRARCRELAQKLSSWLDPNQTGPGIQVFISHTKYAANDTTEGVGQLVRQVRTALGETRLGAFYDAQSLQPAQPWAKALTDNAGRCAVLVLRTDLYATREWCHREVIEAKQRGQPVVVLDALTAGESRGSYLLDHVPRQPMRREHVGAPGGEQVRWSDEDIERGINRLVDAWLERVLWDVQQKRLTPEHPEHDPTAPPEPYRMPQAPELLTLLKLLQDKGTSTSTSTSTRAVELHVTHPDPPLSEAEREPLKQLARAFQRELHLTTPSMLAVRPAAAATHAVASASLGGLRVGLSTSTGSDDVLADLARLGLTRQHHDLTLRAIARSVLVHGGTLAYGGHLGRDGCTPILMDEVERYAQQAEKTGAVDLDGQQAPLWLVLSWSEHRQCTLKRLREVDASLSLHGRLRCLGVKGEVIDMAAERPDLTEDAVPKSVSKQESVSSLTAMRHHLDTETQARVLAGGKREGFAGKAPGLLEEAILALDKKKPSDRRPLYLIGGLGGITAHMVAEMDPGHPACAELADPGVVLNTKARRAMKQFLLLLQGKPSGSPWAKLGNCLSDDENRQLATSNRPAEIAALICRGLQRVKAQGATMPAQSAD